MAFGLSGNGDDNGARALARPEPGTGPVSLSLVAGAEGVGAVAGVVGADSLSASALWHVSAGRRRTVSDRMSTIKARVRVVDASTCCSSSTSKSGSKVLVMITSFFCVVV